MASSFSIESRHPYMDKRLVEFSLGLPWDQKNRTGWEKYILRKASKNLVPDDIRWRKGREHVGWEYQETFVHLIYPQLQAILSDKNNTVFDYFNFSAAQELFKKHEAENKKYDSLPLLHLFGLHCWLNSEAMAE